MQSIMLKWRATALFIFILLLLWSGLFQLHPPVGWVDPGLYLYWFLNPAGNLALRGGDYHGSRVAFILPGWALHSVFDIVTAQMILVSIYALVALIAIYAIAASVVNSFAARAALLILVATNPIWLAAITRGYVDGPSMALGLAALACVARREGPAGFLGHAGAGTLLTLALATHPFGGGLAGLALLGFVLVRSSGLRRLILSGSAMALGGFAGLALCSLGSGLIGFPYLFFLNSSLQRLQEGLAISGPSPFLQPLEDWVGGATRLTLFALTLIATIAVTWRARGRDRLALALGAASLLPIVALLISVLLWSSFVLQFSFYASYIWLALIPALILLARGMEHSSVRPEVWLLVACAPLAAIVLGTLLSLDIRFEPSFHWIAWLAVLTTLGAAVLALLMGRHSLAFIAAAMTVSLAGATNRDTASALRLRGGGDHTAQLESFRRLHAFLIENGALQGRYLLWYGRDRFTEQRAISSRNLHELRYGDNRIYMNALDSLGAPIGWYAPAIGFQMPFPRADVWGQANLLRITDAPESLITLCAEPADCEAGMDALRALGLKVAPGSNLWLDVSGAVRVHVALASVQAAQHAAQPSFEQMQAVLSHLVRVDAMEAGRGAPWLHPGQRASWTDEASLPMPRAKPQPIEIQCRLQGAHLDCEVVYRLCETMLTRGLRFERQGGLLPLISANPPGVRPELVAPASSEGPACSRPDPGIPSTARDAIR